MQPADRCAVDATASTPCAAQGGKCLELPSGATCSALSGTSTLCNPLLQKKACFAVLVELYLCIEARLGTFALRLP